MAFIRVVFGQGDAEKARSRKWLEKIFSQAFSFSKMLNMLLSLLVCIFLEGHMETAKETDVKKKNIGLEFCRQNKEGVTKAIARSWVDEAFRARLLSNPKIALEEVGVTVPQDFIMRIMEDSCPNTLTLTLPCKPEGLLELPEEEKEQIAKQACFFLSSE